MRVRSIAVVGTAVLVLGACGSNTTNVKAASPQAPTTTSAAKLAHQAGSHDMADMKQAKLGHALAVLANGKIDPAKIDLSGVPGVTVQQQAWATALLKRTLAVLPRWANYDADVKAGFDSIGDGLTGDEHLMHWDWINDNRVYDPNYPEALVFKVDRQTGKKKLEAAMFMLPEKYNLTNAPKNGGALMQFHIHDNLCFTPFPAPKVAGLTTGPGTCPKGLTFFHPNIMVHVWLYQNPCGPFAALEGIGAGTTKDGERACDTMHGLTL